MLYLSTEQQLKIKKLSVLDKYIFLEKIKKENPKIKAIEKLSDIKIGEYFKGRGLKKWCPFYNDIF